MRLFGKYRNSRLYRKKNPPYKVRNTFGDWDTADRATNTRTGWKKPLVGMYRDGNFNKRTGSPFGFRFGTSWKKQHYSKSR